MTQPNTRPCPLCAEPIAADAIYCKHCHSDLNGEASKKPAGKKPSLLSKIVVGAGMFGIVLVMFNAVLDSNSEKQSAESATADRQKVADLAAYVNEHEPVDTRYVFDDVLHDQIIDMNLVNPAPAIDLTASGVTFSSTSDADDYNSVERTASVESGQRVSLYQAVDGTDPWDGYNFSLIAFLNASGEDVVGWIDSRYLLTIADYETANATFIATPAGKICNEHKDWSYTDCERVADKKYWVGMSLDMLKAERGIPNAANPSNYGNGTQWQWCWHNYTPSCFYDNDNDGLIDSYN